MDTNAGEFVGEERAEAWMQRIEIGEIVKIKGEELEVVKIGRSEITLKLLSAHERTMKKLQAVENGNNATDREIQRQRKKMLKHQR